MDAEVGPQVTGTLIVPAFCVLVGGGLLVLNDLPGLAVNGCADMMSEEGYLRKGGGVWGKRCCVERGEPKSKGVL